MAYVSIQVLFQILWIVKSHLLAHRSSASLLSSHKFSAKREIPMCSFRALVTILCNVTPALFRKVVQLVVQATVNVTLQMIRAVKLVAVPKHCQILCDCRESMTVLSTLIVAVEARESDLHDIDGRKQRCLGSSADSFVFICCPMWLRLCLSLFFNAAVLPFFI